MTLNEARKQLKACREELAKLKAAQGIEYATAGRIDANLKREIALMRKCDELERLVKRLSGSDPKFTALLERLEMLRT